MGWPTLKPEEVHPSHDVRDEGWYVSDPVCQHCRIGLFHDSHLLRLPCGDDVPLTPI
jgi:hypothetical protein